MALGRGGGANVALVAPDVGVGICLSKPAGEALAERGTDDDGEADGREPTPFVWMLAGMRFPLRGGGSGGCTAVTTGAISVGL
jgi:hypothetical protein